MVPGISRKVDQSDQDFVDTLRAAVAAYLQAVDQWEATYNRYYRLPGHAHVVSSDMESEQREFETQRRVLGSLHATGAVPKFVHELRQRGIEVDMGIFRTVEEGG